MKTGTFMDIVGFHYNTIKKLFISRIVNDNRKFDEDAFNDAFIKCANKFGESIITYDDAIKYYWIAFNNTSKNYAVYSSKYDLFDEFVDSFMVNFSTDDEELEYFYNTVMDAIAHTFDENDMFVYNLHMCYGWQKEDIEEAGYDCKKFKNKIQTIHEFVKEYCKNNKNLNKRIKRYLKRLAR